MCEIRHADLERQLLRLREVPRAGNRDRGDGGGDESRHRGDATETEHRATGVWGDYEAEIVMVELG